MNSVIALTGRLVDLAANAETVPSNLATQDRERLATLADEIAGMRARIRIGARPDPIRIDDGKASVAFPLLPELEKTASLIPQAFSPAQSTNAATLSDIDENPRTRWLVADAFTNPDYVRFALKGCLAATICYILYMAVDWPGISTSVITCLITALSTLGASRQKQILRISGATFGGLLGILAIVFLLPNIDRIPPVALLFAAVSAFGAWVASSSPRLSYFGLQTCLAFYLTTLQDYAAPTSLAPARDRFLGVLLGLTVMWIVFDNLWPASALDEMKKTLRENIRRVAALTRVLDRIEGERTQAIPDIRRLRELINSGFQTVQADAGTVLFEFGANRAENLAMREETLRMQASIRTLFLLELAILQYRLQLNTHDIPENVRRAQIGFDEAIARALNRLADSAPKVSPGLDTGEAQAAEEKLEAGLNSWYRSSRNEQVAVRAQGVVSLSRRMVDVLNDVR